MIKVIKMIMVVRVITLAGLTVLMIILPRLLTGLTVCHPDRSEGSPKPTGQYGRSFAALRMTWRVCACMREPAREGRCTAPGW
jgi:hypothetical protein